MDPVSRLGLSVALVLAVAKVGGDLAVRLRQPPVLGELLGGLLLGCVPVPLVAALRSDPSVDLLAQLGVLLLLFQVGLESTVREVARVGLAAAAVALLGTVGTLLCGWAAAALAVPDAGTFVHLFLAAALTATSIGISARVLKDAGASRSREANTILGASVIDDVLGLVVLAVATRAASATPGTPLTALGVAELLGKTVALLTVAVVAGARLSPLLFRLTARLRSPGVLVATGLGFCFVLSSVASAAGLAPLVGAFAAGLVLEDGHSARFVARGERPLAEQLEPLSAWLVPVFFVLTGMRAELRALADGASLALVVALTAAAVVGKLACVAGAPRGADRLTVALGMLPRGEVSLVFASLGLSLGLLSPRLYAALVAVVVLTALVTPAALRARLARSVPVAAR